MFNMMIILRQDSQVLADFSFIFDKTRWCLDESLFIPNLHIAWKVDKQLYFFMEAFPFFTKETCKSWKLLSYHIQNGGRALEKAEDRLALWNNL